MVEGIKARVTQAHMHPSWDSAAGAYLLDVPRLLARTEELEDALREVGNVIGGPTMTYSGIHEIREWRARAQKIAALVSGVLTDEDQHS